MFSESTNSTGRDQYGVLSEIKIDFDVIVFWCPNFHAPKHKTLKILLEKISELQ